MNMLRLTAILLALGLAACSAGPASGVPPVSEEVDTVRPVEKPGEAGADDDEGFGETEEEPEVAEEADAGTAEADAGETDASE